ncbi:bifunctional diaminohydroxyphosphoribosylaminopyrimidine deaminase/5-amino-6-(5-phosphoribosylamino)uracil reductase RibD [Tenacibaculum sp. Bg11-29]|uniref:bifunctional diaminohydroxyphosphoribosylaminopyrimidine deaminase/5-amino-6-(5-phosphoribosylamino)uracil reductase RibD n=1 Tax=Tenacibaculum sp. Bg11-29 TaxID=2058306 RepID=UPI000C3236A5|nr:bifunctional diaminohydroxyphosphoribosylaminopyrimidine deaminase/5-amino-6-(5-phosphoribosylamino)uracil reductase RibD [Tenacibaculum sp. Bg11-29]PKH51735.1 bifunctional diaminohydroxyphosphoribosylaminopyrimidine deaminase/5-amino-6-(5-phosphoribosylamino)uracil reductase RibD [Tenacibaculum sp. Bg11-29]
MNHEKYIKRCLELASNGIGTARPNPSVGAVVLYDNKIIGEGYTNPYGGSHAEVNAINSVKDKELLKQATIYVTLEPCSHFGKTPPCADLIVKNNIPNVVIGCVDTNSLVAGKGIERLKKAGINVVVGILENECKKHHKRFFTVQNKKRPYIILKWAETTDGYVAPITKDEQKPVWISNKYSQQLVHKWRSEEHAILVGTNTVIADNPSLTVRNWTGNNPIRIVLDKNERIPGNATVFDKSVKTIVITEKRNNSEESTINDSQFEHSRELIFEQIDFSSRVAEQICEVLQKHSIQSVIIEGGTQTLQTFVDANLWDEAKIFVGKIVFGSGVVGPILKGKLEKEENIEGDVLKTYIND